MKSIITITNRLDLEISRDDIKEIYKKSMGDGDFEVVIDEGRTFGHYITIENEKIKKFVLLSSKTNESRNAYLSQFIFPAYSSFITDNTSKQKVFEVYLFPNNTVDANYNIFIFRLLKTLDIVIINESDFLKSEIPKFHNYKDIETFRNNNRDRNSNNNSTYFSEEEDRIEVYAKVFGANGEESAFLCLILKKVSRKPIWLYQVFDNDQKSLPHKILTILESAGVEIKEEISEVENPSIELTKPEKDLRDTPKFHYNLLKKFNFKKCYLCACDIGPIIIGSHIHRVADIKNDTSISVEEKIQQIVDGDNGLWLCASHDKLFESGLVYFQDDKLKISNILTKIQITFVEDITKNDTIESDYFNKKMKNYIDLHFKRTQSYSS
jgi:hypothetical protein